MRLFRRSLLCLVLGVTAFGVAGWGFRPRASWSVELGSQEQGFAFSQPSGDSGSDDFWVYGLTNRSDPKSTQTGLRFSRDGRLLRKVEFPYTRHEAPFVADSGDLVAPYPTWGGGKPSETEFLGFGATEADDFKSRLISDRSGWQVAANGEIACELPPQDEPIVCRIANVKSGRILSTVHFGRRSDDRERNRAEISRDARLIAVPTVEKGAAPSFEVCDARTGEIVHRVPAPTQGRYEAKAYRASFSHDGLALHLSHTWPSNEEFERWVYRFADGRLIRSTVQDAETPATSSPKPDVDRADESERGLHVSTVYDEKTTSGWLRVDDGTTVLSDWRKLPAPVDLVWRFADSMRRTLQAEFVPETDNVVVVFPEPPIEPSLPLGLGKLAPTNWKLGLSRTVIRWHDWKRNEWRTIASFTGSASMQARANALLTIVHSDEQPAILQSWPLPPRDPKWPALGIAAVCMAGTWWVCAKRYAQRLKRSARILSASA